MGIHKQQYFESCDAGFSCPSCGEFTEDLYCNSCGVEISPEGELVIKSDIENQLAREVDVCVDTNKNAAGVIVGIKEIKINGKVYEFYGPRMTGTDFIFFLKVGGEDLKITCNPFSEKKIKYISKKGNRNRKFVSPSDFGLISTIIGVLKNNPGKYGLGNLKIFHH